MKNKKLFMGVGIAAIILVICAVLYSSQAASEKAKQEEKTAQLKEQVRQKVWLENCVDIYSNGTFKHSYQFNKRYQKVDELIRADIQLYKDQESKITSMHLEFKIKNFGNDSAFLNSAPEFTDLNTQADAINQKVKDFYTSTDHYATTKKAKERAKAAKLTAEEEKLYLDVLNPEKKLQDIAEESQKNIQASGDDTVQTQSVLKFLTLHQSEWKNEGGTIVFYNNDTYEQYQSLIKIFDES